MRGLTLCWLLAALFPLIAFAEPKQPLSDTQIDHHIDQLQEPL